MRYVALPNMGDYVSHSVQVLGSLGGVYSDFFNFTRAVVVVVFFLFVQQHMLRCVYGFMGLAPALPGL